MPRDKYWGKVAGLFSSQRGAGKSVHMLDRCGESSPGMGSSDPTTAPELIAAMVSAERLRS